MKKYLLVGSIILILFGALGYMRTFKKTPSVIQNIPQLNVQITPQSTLPVLTITQKKSREIIVTSTSYAFVPNIVSFKSRERVVLVFKNIEGAHSIDIPALGIKTKILQAGEEARMDISVKKPGTYEFYCLVGNHKAQGMTGKIIVTE